MKNFTQIFLVYIQNNGQVLYNFAQTKQILEVFKKLCLGVDETYKELCYLFDRETQDGQNMTRYNTLLTQAIEQIVAVFQTREIAHLQSGRDAQLFNVAQRVSQQTDFNLITWLVIKNI